MTETSSDRLNAAIDRALAKRGLMLAPAPAEAASAALSPSDRLNAAVDRLAARREQQATQASSHRPPISTSDGLNAAVDRLLRQGQ
ncbi:hypothetical protein [Bradyrhizobium sp. USDA 3364]